ncbi:hypothetical protein CC86DRAFT_168601 [Ophiobolus disseminans]|uniref:MARVEL domain-containing protein n=1 Tax=Ophiobolus disseminans TaxID=1469910 RepID=A0A6A7ADW4_9PLEO|nr:hypothetical protein CC86DRAFT_168601 [Ophiobolus disseminans]
MAQKQQPALWKKRVLVPFWLVRICLMIFTIAAFAYTLRHINEVQDIVKPTVAPVIIYLLCVVIVLLVDILAIVLFLRDALKPGTFLTMNCFQTGFWGGAFIVNLAAIGRGADTVAIGFSVLVLAIFVGPLIYSIVVYRRAKQAGQRGQYVPALNPSAPAPFGQPPPYQSASPYHQGTEYHSQSGAPVELQSQYVPPYQGGGASGYYQQPAKPAHIV